MIAIGQQIEYCGMLAVVVGRVVEPCRGVNLILSFGDQLVLAVAEKEVIRMAERVTVSIVGDAALAASVADAIASLASRRAGTHTGDTINLEVLRVGRFYNLSTLHTQSLYNTLEALYNDAVARQVSPYGFLWKALSVALPGNVVTLIRASYNALNVAQAQRARKGKPLQADQLRF